MKEKLKHRTWTDENELLAFVNGNPDIKIIQILPIKIRGVFYDLFYTDGEKR